MNATIDTGPSTNSDVAGLLTIDPSLLNSSVVEAHYTYDPRRMSVLRQLLELLGVPLPSWAIRKPAGRKPIIIRGDDAGNLYLAGPEARANSPTFQRRTAIAQQKALARQAAAKAKESEGLAKAGNLYGSLFPQAAD